jgi:hypothetical protein
MKDTKRPKKKTVRYPEKPKHEKPMSYKDIIDKQIRQGEMKPEDRINHRGIVYPLLKATTKRERER